MSGLAYGLISLAVVYVIGWYIRNERAGGVDSAGEIGVIAMTSARRQSEKLSDAKLRRGAIQ